MDESSKKGKHGAADANEAMASAEATDAGETTIANGEAAEPRRDPSLEQGHGDAARLKRLNDVLVVTATEERKRAATLEARLGEVSTDAAAIADADAERAVLLAAISAPLRAAEEDRAALPERVAAARDCLGCAQAEAAVAENGLLAQQLRAKEDEAAAAAELVAGLEAAVAGLESQKAVLESSVNDLRKENKMYMQEMEAKLEDQMKESEALQSRKSELEAKVGSLEAELSVAVARSHELELGLGKMVPDIVVKTEKLQAMLAEMEQMHNVLVAQVARLECEAGQLVKTNQSAAAAREAEKKALEAELETLKGSLDRINVSNPVASGKTDTSREDEVPVPADDSTAPQPRRSQRVIRPNRKYKGSQ